VFEKACSRIRNAIYGFKGISQVGTNQVNCCTGTAFMIAPGVIVTAAHAAHIESNHSRPTHTVFEVIRALDVGQTMERAQLIAEDAVRDIAIFRLTNPRSNACVSLKVNRVPIGISCGSLGFPLAFVNFTQTGSIFNLVERFQGANISAFHTQTVPSGRQLSFYETDALMYQGSSGCPGFLPNGKVFGMHISVVIDPSTQRNQGLSNTQSVNRLAISNWVPSMDIIQFAMDNHIALPRRWTLFI
jgi:hypothetical protein